MTDLIKTDIPYRYIHLGHRRFESGMGRGLVIRSGSRVEKFVDGLWILVDIMHPDDAERFVLLRTITEEDIHETRWPTHSDIETSR